MILLHKTTTQYGNRFFEHGDPIFPAPEEENKSESEKQFFDELYNGLIDLYYLF